MRNEIITLVTKYNDGKEKKENIAEVFATRKSLTRNEFYASYGVGLRLQYAFDIMPDEYFMSEVVFDGKHYWPTHVRVGSVEYAIVRTYQKNKSSMELIVG